MLRLRQERGSTTLEVVVIGPALLALLALVIVAGRVSMAGQSVQTAAAQAARATTLARTPAGGADVGRETAERILAGQNLRCVSTDVEVQASDLALPVGQPGSVTVTVACRARLNDVGLPGMPGSKILTAKTTMPIDPWTARP